MFEPIIKEIQAYDTIIIHRHSRPDGDAIGSQIGLKHLLQVNFPNKKIYTVGDEAESFAFMEDSNMDTISDSTFNGSLSIILDCGGANMVSDTRYSLAAKTVRIDHHLFTGQFADVEVIDCDYESCAGLIAMMAMESGWKLTPIAAKSLYIGMVTDSGRFRYDKTSANTFRLAAFLMEQKFDTEAIFRDLYADDFENKKVKAQFLLKTQFTEHRVAYIYTTIAEREALNLSAFTVSRGMVNTMSDIKGTSIWVNFTETEEGVLCELRSNDLNINPIAVKYGGGGHAKASGATVPDRETAMAMLHDLDQMLGD
ncbi:MAG: bifunctional oligoribonuclease/PAP phosphatase NrnA [Lachnospiraceae bacterium]|nr:bifunctional oligoribonuclease/PAP phosphatase NrnA [Lachnospiraceae bacterium]